MISLHTLLLLTTLNSDLYRGNLLSGAVQFSPSEKTHVTLGVARLTREFDGGTSFTENSLNGALAFAMNEKYYAEVEASITPNAKILARERVLVTPHAEVAGIDLGLGVGYSHYENLNAGLFKPSIQRELPHYLTGVLASHIVRTSETIAAFEARLQWKPESNHRVNGSVAGGRTLEDAGLETNFKSTRLEYGYNFASWIVYVSQEKYWSDTRREDAYTLRLEFR